MNKAVQFSFSFSKRKPSQTKHKHFQGLSYLSIGGDSPIYLALYSYCKRNCIINYFSNQQLRNKLFQYSTKCKPEAWKVTSYPVH